MPLDPATLVARTTAGDAELSAPRHGLAIAQRRLLSLLDQPLALDELAARPGLQADRLERDLTRLAEVGLVQVHRPAGTTGPMFPPKHRPAAGREVAPPPTPTIAPVSRPMLTLPPAASSAAPPTASPRRVRRGRALFVGFASLAAVGLGIWFFAAPTAEPPRPPPAPRATATPARPPPAPAPSAPARSIEPVRVLVTPDPSPARPAAVAAPAAPAAPASAETRPAAAPPIPPATMPAPALVFEPPSRAPATPAPEPIAPLSLAAPAVATVAPPQAQLAVAAPVIQETRIAPLTLTPVTREVPSYPREALQAGVGQGTVKARLSVDAAGRVTAVDIVDAQPMRVFDRAVTRSLARWTFAPGADGRTTDVEIAFRRD